MTGGLNDDNRPVASVEFYVAVEDKWRMVTPMSTPRYYHSTTIAGGNIAVAGGAPSYDSVEFFNGTHWLDVNRLTYGVYRYTCSQFCSPATKKTDVNIHTGTLLSRPAQMPLLAKQRCEH